MSDLPTLPSNWTTSEQGPFLVADCPEIKCRLMYAPDNDQSPLSVARAVELLAPATPAPETVDGE